MIGAAARIVLPRVIGPEAVGLLQMVYPVYSIFLVISISGLPVAISKLVSEQVALGNPREAKRIFHLATALLFSAGLSLSALLYLAAPFIAQYIIKDSGTILPLRALSPAVFLLSFSAAYRGYFQGVQEMRPSAAAQVIEQSARVAVMIFLAVLFMDRGVEWAATGAAFGTVAGATLTLLFLSGTYFVKGRSYLVEDGVFHRPSRKRLSSLAIMGRIYQLALPIVSGTLIFPISQSLDAVLVPRKLQHIGYSLEMARSLYGQLTGMAMALVHFPCVLTIGLATALIPAVSESVAKKQFRVLKERISNSLWLSVAVGLPASVGLVVLAKPIATFLFKIPEVAIPLRTAAFATVFIALSETTIGILQGMGKVMVPVRYLFFGAVVKVILTYFLTGMPSLGIKGAAIATVVGLAIPALLNFKALYKYSGYLPDLIQLLIKPGLAAALMGVAVARTYPLLEIWSMYLFTQVNLAFTVSGGIIVALVVYLLAMLAIGGVPPRFYHLLRASNGRILRV